MARIVVGIAASHSPQLSTPSELWQLHAERDRLNKQLHFRGTVYDYEGLIAARSEEHLDRELSDAIWLEKHRRCDRGIDALAETLAAASPDVVLIVGDDQREMFLDDGMPTLAVFWGDTVECVPKPEEELPPSLRPARWANYGEHREVYRCVPDLGRHVVERMMVEGYDVAQLTQQPSGRSIGHAFNFVKIRIMRGNPAPMLPVMVNTYFPPNQPTAGRCYGFGGALRRAVESFDRDLRVAVVASGGLSHFVIDEELDQRVLDAFRSRDVARIGGIAQTELVSGTSEIRNWVVVAGATEHLDLEVLDYVPTYRSPAGTGCGMGFARWC
ncbi:MAG TPA: protocatechuate 3,4-dioxygenase [Candidatus Dormibacteraeota bacterium]|nr:protocatechuate 3,4-dioxygenase [Candidatus Dormibacteraeota bacterium]